jgi:hypothetical protein
LWIVLPITLSLATDIAVEIVVLIEIIIVVDVDVAVVPIAIAPIAPVAAPSAPSGGTQRNSRAPHQTCAWIVAGITVGVVGILGGRSSVNNRWVVRWDVSYIGTGLLNFDHLLTAPGRTAPHRLGLHDLLRTGFQISGALGLRAHALNCGHYVRLLRQECVSHVRGPLDVVGHTLHHVWKRYQSLDAWVPRLFCHRVRQRLAL